MHNTIMKIITKNAVIVQLNDIAYLNYSVLPIPTSIFNKVYGDSFLCISHNNRYDFIKFDKKLEIDFSKKINWIIFHK